MSTSPCPPGCTSIPGSRPASICASGPYTFNTRISAMIVSLVHVQPPPRRPRPHRRDRRGALFALADAAPAETAVSLIVCELSVLATATARARAGGRFDTGGGDSIAMSIPSKHSGCGDDAPRAVRKFGGTEVEGEHDLPGHNFVSRQAPRGGSRS